MVLSRKIAFQEHASRVLASLKDSKDGVSVYQCIETDDPEFKKVSVQNFNVNFICASLALIAQTWETSCRNEGLKEPEFSKAFLRKILDAFQGPEELKAASTFSEYYSAFQTEDQDSECASLAAVMFKRLEQKSTLNREGGKAVIRPAFYQLVSALEGLRSSFENQFFEFLHHS